MSIYEYSVMRKKGGVEVVSSFSKEQLDSPRATVHHLGFILKNLEGPTFLQSHFDIQSDSCIESDQWVVVFSITPSGKTFDCLSSISLYAENIDIKTVKDAIKEFVIKQGILLVEKEEKHGKT